MITFEKVFHFMKKPWGIIFYAILVILAYYFVDKPMATYFHQLDLRTEAHSLELLTLLGQAIIYVILFLGLGLYFRYLQPNAVYEARAWYLLACLLVTNLVCFSLKIALGRARPDLLFAHNEFGFYGLKSGANYWSFPSGHTTTIISLAAGLGILFSRYFSIFLTIALFVVASRVLLYRHYLSDVMSAFYITLLTVGVFTEYLKKNNWFKKTGYMMK